MTKKLLVLLLVVLLTVSMQAGCVTKNKVTNHGTNTNANADTKVSSGQQSQTDVEDEFAKYQPKQDV